jgi:hypothetical protein
MITAPSAHARWFVDEQRDFPVEWGSLGSVETLAALAAVALLLAAIVAVSPSLPRRLVAPRARIEGAADRVPALLAVTLGLGLIGMSALGYVWMRPMPEGDLGTLFAALQVQTGVWLLLGVARAAAALAVVALTALVAVAIDPVGILAAAYVPAAAVALLAFSTSRRTARPARAVALTALRTGMGVALVTAALAEKLLAPSMTILVLDSHPELDVLGAIGIGSGPATFTLVAGSVELLLGGLLLARVALPLVALVTLGPLVATVPVFGVTEVVGHLPIYGALLAIAALSLAPVPRAAAAEVT